MEVCHDGEAEATANHAPEFHTIIRGDAREHRVRDFLIICDDSAADGEDNDSGHHPANTKIPIHKLIISYIEQKI